METSGSSPAVPSTYKLKGYTSRTARSNGLDSSPASGSVVNFGKAPRNRTNDSVLEHDFAVPDGLNGPPQSEEKIDVRVDKTGNDSAGPSSDITDGVEEDASDEEMEWDEVNVGVISAVGEVSSSTSAAAMSAPIEVTLARAKRKDEAVKKKGTSNMDRMIRLESHKFHTVALLANASIRNRWLNDQELHARLISLTPLRLQSAFVAITKKNQPDAIRRGRQFEAALTHLTDWWHETFEIDVDAGVRSQTWDEVWSEMIAQSSIVKGKGRARDTDEGEPIKSPKSLMKHLLMMRGSRDVSAQLFTALLRAIGAPARLVVSLQGVPWQSYKKPPPKAASDKKRKGGITKKSFPPVDEDTSDSEDMEEVHIPRTGKGKGKARDDMVSYGEMPEGSRPLNWRGEEITPRVVKLRKSRPNPRVSNITASSSWSGLSEFPVFWTEVFSRPDQRWLSVDPWRNLVNAKRKFQPESTDRRNRMVYVIAIEEDGYARDVTQRYTREYGARIIRARAPVRSKVDWWGNITRFLSRPYRLNRDDIEDAELQTNQMSEVMPNSVGAFKSHPLYALERHLRREEVIHPRTELGKFRGEPVYPRRSVVPLKTPENWMRQGRKVKEGEQAMKSVKQRAVTLEKRRAQEMAQLEGEEVTQGLYAEWQTESYRPEPIIDGVVPKNNFGNIDLYTPSMLPEGGVHLPYKGIAKVARKLGFDYAEAVTGFEFKKRRALPVLDGIVVALEHEETLLEAYWETAQAAEEKERSRRQEKVIKRWVRLIQGLRIRQRLQNQYASATERPIDAPRESKDDFVEQEAGGFLTSINDVVQPYQLPKQLFADSTSHAAEEIEIADVNYVTQAESSVLKQPYATEGFLEGDQEVLNGDVKSSGRGEESLRTGPISANGVFRTAPESAAVETRPFQRRGLDQEKEQESSRETLQARTTRSGNLKGAAATLPKAARSTRKRSRASSPMDAHRQDDFTPGAAKKARPNKQAVPPSTRTLRTRTQKTRDQLAADEELEAAFKEAAEEG